MAKVRIELNRAGVAKFLREQKQNPKMLGLLDSEGQKLAGRAGDGFAVKRMEQRRNRPGVIVYPETRAAKKAQVEQNALGKALGGKVAHVTKDGRTTYGTEAQINHWTRGRR